MNLPTFAYAEEEENYLHKLHNEGWTVDYKSKNPDQLEFNRLYERCRKRRTRRAMPPLFEEPRRKALYFASDSRGNQQNLKNVPSTKSLEDYPQIVLDIIEDEPDESDGRPEIPESKLHSNLDESEVILDVQVIEDSSVPELEVVPEPEITFEPVPENNKTYVKRVVQLDWLLNSTEISAHEGVRYVSNRLAAKAREEREKESINSKSSLV